MAKNLPVNIIAAKNKLNQDDPWLTFLTLTMPDSTVIRVVNDVDDQTFGGYLYTAMPFTVGVNKYSANSTIPTMEIQISNVLTALQQYIEAYDGLVDSDVSLVIANAGLLSADYTNLTIDLKIVATTVDSSWAVFTLGVSNPLRQRFPLFVYLTNMCNWVSHYKGTECAYSGALTSCKGTWEDCELHSNTARFGGFRGLSSSDFRIA